MKKLLVLVLVLIAVLFWVRSQPASMCGDVTETLLAKVKNDESFRYKSCEVDKVKEGEKRYTGFFIAKNGFGAEITSFFNCSDKKGVVSCYVK